MYTWGYIMNAVLAKLDLEEDEAKQQNLLNRFKIYANEAMTQISSTVKPDWKYAKFRIWRNEYIARQQLSKEGKSYDEIEEILSTNPFVDILQNMPEGFISFGNDVNRVSYFDCYGKYRENEECFDTDIIFVGRQIKFLREGEYEISYNSKWKIYNDGDKDYFMFTDLVDDDYEINVPDDILECLPSYIASQCYKIDDEVKASIYRNEYEMFVARIDATNYSNTRNITIGGNW